MINKFLTFTAGDDYHSAGERVVSEAKSTNWFKHHVHETSVSAENKFNSTWSKHKTFFESNERGYGYWLWKPLIILEHLLKMSPGATLLYADAGCVLNNNEDKRREITRAEDTLSDQEFIITGWANPRIQYVKRDLLFKFNIKEKPTGRQRAATSVLIKNTPTSIKFLREWIHIGTMDGYHYISDAPSIHSEYPEFIDHRHDQSILDLLCDKYKIQNKIQTQAFIGYARKTPRRKPK